MQRFRTIAGPPQRTATSAWDTVSTLISDTLTVSTDITESSVAAALAPMRGIGPALVAAGHLETAPAVLVSGTLHLSITVATGAAVSTVQENLNPVPGGASATSGWTLYLPNPVTFAVALDAAVAYSEHLSSAPAPADSDDVVEASAQPGMVNLAALKKLGSSS